MSTGFNSLQVQTVHNMFFNTVGKDKCFLMFWGHLRLNLKKNLCANHFFLVLTDLDLIFRPCKQSFRDDSSREYRL